MADAKDAGPRDWLTVSRLRAATADLLATAPVRAVRVAADGTRVPAELVDVTATTGPAGGLVFEVRG